MRRQVMKMAWELLRKGFDTNFGSCLKKSWSLNKQLKSQIISSEAATDLVLDLQNSVKRHVFESSNWEGRNYVGTGELTFNNCKLWVKGNVARVYTSREIDGISIGQTYVA